MALLRKTATIAGSSWLTVLISLITGVVTIRYLGASGRGEIVLFVSWCSIFAFLLNFGLPASAAFHNATGKFSVKTILTSYVALTPILFVVLYAAFQIVPDTYVNNVNLSMSNNDYLLLALVYVPSIWYQSFSQTLLLSSGRARVFAALNISKALATLVGSAVLLEYYLADPPQIIHLAVLIDLCFGLITSVIALNKSDPLVCQRIFGCQLSLLGYGIKTYPSAALPNTQTHYANLIVGNVLGSESAAFLALANSIYNLVTSIVKPAASLLLGEVGNPEYTDSAARIQRISVTVFYLCLLILPFLQSAAWFLVPILYGPDFTAVIPILFVLLTASAFVNSQAILQVSFLADGKPEIQSYLCLCGSMFLIVSLPGVIPFFGLVGAASMILIARIAIYAATVHILAKTKDIGRAKFLSPAIFYSEVAAFMQPRFLDRKFW